MHIFFDLDGTLTDPKEGITCCIRFALASLGSAVPGQEVLESYIGPPLQESFREMLGSEKLANKALDLYRERFSDVGMFENEIYAGIEDCLGVFSASKEAMYVVTSKPTIYSEKIVEHFGLAGYFRRVYGSNLDGSLANKAALIRFVLDQESVDAADAVMIGDRHFDITGAKSNGMRAIGALWGYGSVDELTEAGADALCEDPSSLYRCVAT